jgi:transcription initiation factor IIE alpha subunit
MIDRPRYLHQPEIVRLLREHGALSEGDIARHAGLNTGVVHHALGAMYAARIIERHEVRKGSNRWLYRVE